MVVEERRVLGKICGGADSGWVGAGVGWAVAVDGLVGIEVAELVGDVLELAGLIGGLRLERFGRGLWCGRVR